jgi:hypothetical protein
MATFDCVVLTTVAPQEHPGHPWVIAPVMPCKCGQQPHIRNRDGVVWHCGRGVTGPLWAATVDGWNARVSRADWPAEGGHNVCLVRPGVP